MQASRLKGSEERRAYLTLVLPAFLVYLTVMAFPILLSIILSVSDYNGGQMFGGKPWKITGFGTYARILSDQAFWAALKNNVYVVLVSVFGQLPLGFVFAYLIFRRIVKGADFWQGILYVPNIISVIVVGILWQTIFSPNGPLAEAINLLMRSGVRERIEALIGAAANGGVLPDDSVLQKLLDIGGTRTAGMFTDAIPELREFISGYGSGKGAELITDLTNLFAPSWSPAFLTRRDVAMIPVLFVILWMYTGMYLIMFLANMQKIDVQIIESARIDGAHEGQVMRYIIMPALSGTIVNSAILAIAGSLSSFALIFAMTGGGPSRVTEVLSIYMYNNAFLGKPDFPLSNAIALITVAISFMLIALTKVLEKRFGGKE